MCRGSCLRSNETSSRLSASSSARNRGHAIRPSGADHKSSVLFVTCATYTESVLIRGCPGHLAHFFVLGVISAVARTNAHEEIAGDARVGTMERAWAIRSTIAFQWFAVAVVAWRAWAHGFTASQLGLTIHDRTGFLLPRLVGAANHCRSPVAELAARGENSA